MFHIIFHVHFVHVFDYIDDVHVTSFHIYFNVDFFKFLIFCLAKGLCESKELHECRVSADSTDFINHEKKVSQCEIRTPGKIVVWQKITNVLSAIHVFSITLRVNLAFMNEINRLSLFKAKRRRTTWLGAMRAGTL